VGLLRRRAGVVDWFWFGMHVGNVVAITVIQAQPSLQGAQPSLRERSDVAIPVITAELSQLDCHVAALLAMTRITLLS